MTEHEVSAAVDELCRRASDRRGDVVDVVLGLIEQVAPLADDHERDRIVRRSCARLDGLDALGALLDDPDVDEVMVNRGREVWIDRGGRLTQVAVLAPGTVDNVLERVLAPLGRRLDRRSPYVDARLPDGARLCAVVPPVAVDGTCLSIRRHRTRSIALERFAGPDVVPVIESMVANRANVLVTGATSTGKTTFLAALLATLGPAERLVVIEDTAELDVTHHHAVRLETRIATADGVGAVGAAELVRTSLRLRPDRLIVGEFRGDEAVAIVEALNTGHDGSLSTCHANSAVDGLRRLETLVMQAVPTWPLAAIRRQVTRSIDAVIHLRRGGDGHRRVAEIAEVIEGDGEPSARPIIDGDDVLAPFGRSRR